MAKKKSPSYDDTPVEEATETGADAADAGEDTDAEPPESEAVEAEDATEGGVTDETAEAEETDETDETGAAQGHEAESETAEAGTEEEAESPGESAEDTGAAEEMAEADDESIQPFPAPAPLPEQVVLRQGGFVPMVLGGIVAAAIGFGAAQYGIFSTGDETDLSGIETALEAQDSAIADLSAQVEALSGGPDLSAITQGQADLEAGMASLADRLSAVESQAGALADRLTAIENLPPGDGASGESTAALASELGALKTALADQQAQLDALTAEKRALEESAAAAAQSTLQRAALTRVQTALDAGTGFAPALADLQAAGVAVPDTLSQAAARGVPSLNDLQAQFPDPARAALAASRAVAAESGEGGGFSSFLRTQLGARSLEPKEGGDADAVLSRAEAALREGRLRDALAEIEALPEVGRAELSDWSGEVARRLEAVAAAQELAENLN